MSEMDGSKGITTCRPSYAYLSGYIRYRPVKGYYLVINSRKLASWLLSRSKTKVNVARLQDGTFFVRIGNGNRLRARKKDLITYISCKLLTTEERRVLRNIKRSFSTRLRILPSEFGIDIFDLYPDEDVAKVARCLNANGVAFPEHVMTPFNCTYDLEFTYKDVKVALEVTKLMTSKSKWLNFKHEGIGGNLRSHIFDMYKFCVDNVLIKRENACAFVIIPKIWHDVKHINELIDECRNIGCYILFTDFANPNWPQTVAHQMIQLLEDLIKRRIVFKPLKVLR